MAEISGISSGESISQIYSPVEERKEEESFPVETPKKSTEKLKLLLTQENLQRVISKNLRELDREVAIKTLLESEISPAQKIPLLKELFKIKLETFNKTGLSLEVFLGECKQQLALNPPDFDHFFTGEGSAIKMEVFTIYLLLLHELAQSVKTGFSETYHCPLLQLYELEKETGFSCVGTSLLVKEFEILCEILMELMEGRWLGADILNSKQFYWGIFLPSHQKILALSEKESSMEFFDTNVQSLIPLFFSPQMAKLFPIPDGGIDPSVELLPYIVKYLDIEQIKVSFYLRNADMNEWGKALKWVDLYCQGAEILIPVDPDKAKAYVEGAKTYVEKTFWAYPFSPNQKAWSESKEKALDRIKEVTGELEHV